MGSNGLSGSRPSRIAKLRAASACPVLAHHWPAVSPGAGTMGATRTICSTGISAAIKGAVKAAIDWATTVNPDRDPIAPSAAAA